jgi:alpha-L-arabinofuranosidase
MQVGNTAIRPQNENLGESPETGFFGLSLFDVTAEQIEGEPACSVTCGDREIAVAYAVLTSVATDEEVAGLGMTVDEAKETLIERTEQNDLEPQTAIGCYSLSSGTSGD